MVSSVVIRSEQLHLFQRLSDPWQRQTSGQNQELFAEAASLLDQRSRVNMALSTPGSPRRDRINQAVLHPGREISPHRCCLRRGSNTSRRAAQRGLGDRSGNTGLKRDSVSRPDWEWLVGRHPWNGGVVLRQERRCCVQRGEHDASIAHQRPHTSGLLMPERWRRGA